MLTLAIFNADWYLSRNPDVAWEVLLERITAEDHFRNYGIDEGRTPSALFNYEYYLKVNPDVAEAMGHTAAAAVKHFFTWGHEQGRAFHPSLNLGEYMKANPDVAAAVAQSGGQLSPLDHLVRDGITQARDLGNGVNLSQFANDPGFKSMMENGNHLSALQRVADASPFLKGFQPPAGWVIPETATIPRGFVPANGEKLQIPSYIAIPDWLKEHPGYYEVLPAASSAASASALFWGADAVAHAAMAGPGEADGAVPIELTGDGGTVHDLVF